MTFTKYLLCVLYVGNVAGIIREYWVTTEERIWNYAPSGLNVISGEPIDEDEHAKTFLQQGSNRIGSTYKKVLYIEYTDGSYKKEKKQPIWKGLLGPIISAEIGDTIIVHLFNKASRTFSLHPHGVEYLKKNEGAFYPDNTAGNDKDDDHVLPGKIQTYTWQVVEDQGPTAWDDDCINRVYHSHYDSPRDIYSGLVGTMILCKQGALEKRKKKEQDFVLMSTTVDENMSWYLDENINTYCTHPESVDKEDEDFKNSNLMHCFNGYLFGNLPGLSVCDNTVVNWYMFSMGNEVDVHSIYFYGNVLTYQHRRVDTISLLAASMAQASMSAQNIGKWLITSQVNEHFEAGMQVIYEVRNCSKVGPSNHRFNIRRYYIAANEIIWNYAPTSTNQFTGESLDDPGSDSAKYFLQNDKRIGGKYKKAVYREFTDSTFSREKTRCKEELHLGILGPIIWAKVGDIIEIVFMNNASRSYNMHAHGVSYDNYMDLTKDSAGSDNNDQYHPCQVAPGHTVTLKWKITDNVAPTSDDPVCIAWLYYSSVDPVKDTYSGLGGPLLVCNELPKEQTGYSLYRRNAELDLVLMPVVSDENKSWYLQDNIKLFTGKPESVDVEDPDFVESNTMHSINGYMYGNQPGLEFCVGNKIRWHLLGLGSVIDIHGIHFTGNTFQIHQNTRDVVSVSPHIRYSAVMIPDNDGLFNVECMTADHYDSGMRQHYRVNAGGKTSAKKTPTSCAVTYYIAAEEIEWDYSPSRAWEFAWHPEYSDRPGDVFLNKTQTTIGSIYKKVVYRGYTDETFTIPKKRSQDEIHLGILGPFINGNVGDEIKVVFKNKASRSYSVYAHGLKPRNNETQPTEPGHTETYIWDVPARSGPNSHEIDCLTWAYYSDVNRVKDTYSGLIGPVVICKQSKAPKPKKISLKRFATLFMVFNENESWYLDENIQKYIYPNAVNKENEEFMESNKMHSINGLMYANAVGMTMNVGDHVVWHVMGMGNEVDIHTVHWHGHSMKYTRGGVLQTDVFELFPGTFQTASMTAKSPGTWLLHCHVDDHLYGGMVTVYNVQ